MTALPQEWTMHQRCADTGILIFESPSAKQLVRILTNVVDVLCIFSGQPLLTVTYNAQQRCWAPGPALTKAACES